MMLMSLQNGSLPSAWGSGNHFGSNTAVLDLSNNSLTGTVPDAWGTLATSHPGMQLILFDNQLSGSLPPSFTDNGTHASQLCQRNALQCKLHKCSSASECSLHPYSHHHLSPLGARVLDGSQHRTLVYAVKLDPQSALYVQASHHLLIPPAPTPMQ